jgi:hypothetical protein
VQCNGKAEIGKATAVIGTGALRDGKEKNREAKRWRRNGSP